MITQPILNVIDTAFRVSKNLKYNILLNMQDCIFRSVLQNIEDINFMLVDDSHINDICSVFNWNGVATSSYIGHSQQQYIYQNYHIKDMLIITEPPLKLLKKEDMMLLAERLHNCKKICIGQDIHSQWPLDLMKMSMIEPGVVDIDFNADQKRKELIILSDGSQSSQRISMYLYQKYKDVKIVNSYNDHIKLMETMNEYKVCLNLNTYLDSLFAVHAGCITISKDKSIDQVRTYDTVEDLLEGLDKYIKNFDIKQQQHDSEDISNKYSYDNFEKTLCKSIVEYIREPFIV